MKKSKTNGASRATEIVLTEEERVQIVALDQNALRAKVDLADADSMVAEAEARRAQARQSAALAVEAFRQRVQASCVANHIDPSERWDLNLREGIWRKQ